MLRLLRCLARAVKNNALKVLADAVPFGGALYDVAADAWRNYRQQPQADPKADLAADLQAVAQAPAADVRQEAVAAAKEVAADQPPAVQQALTLYLTQVPAMVRRSLRRPSDPTGTTVPATLSLGKPEDLLSFLPPKLPRFKLGDRPLPGVDWELEELLGVGGFGEVWKARHPQFRGIVAALKFCFDLDPASEKVLRNEVGRVNDMMMGAGLPPGVVRLQHPYLDGDPKCLEYEYVDGGDLAGLIQEMHRNGSPNPEEVARRILDLAGTIRFAHALKPPLVHRDLKPANILVQRSGDGTFSLRVADFGISEAAASQAVGEATRSATNAATAVRGAYTPLYASPQQMKGGPADPRDDVHALGVIWYQMLTGDLMRGRPSGRGWRKQLAERGMAAGLLDLLEACVDDDLSERPTDAGALAEQLTTLLQAKGSPQPPVAPLSDIGLQKPVREFINSLGTRLVLVKPGKFLMGSPSGKADRSDNEFQHEVEITQPYYMAVHPVTVSNFRTFVERTGYRTEAETSGGAQRWSGSKWELDPKANWHKPGFQQGDDHPVTCVSWNDVQELCNWLSGIEKERLYRLPTEAEWEYACRGAASSSTPFYFGASLSSTQANFDGNYPYGGASKGPYLGRTTPVGSYPPNAFGLYDMHGNVWEWCQDWHGENYYRSGPGKDPPGPATGASRVLRGGSWNRGGRICRAACRSHCEPGHRYNDIGFRLVCSAARTL
jgi:formylglycine-generating enzyme required for sulfatase activity